MRLIFTGSKFNFPIISDTHPFSYCFIIIVTKASCTSLDHFYFFASVLVWSSNNALNCDVSFVFYSGQYGRVHIGRLADEFHSHHMPVTIKTLRGKDPYSYLGTILSVVCVCAGIRTPQSSLVPRLAITRYRL